MEQHIGFTKTELKDLRDKIDEALEYVEVDVVCPKCGKQVTLDRNYWEGGNPTCGECVENPKVEEGPKLEEVEEQ